MTTLGDRLRQHAHQDGVYLVPLRLFIGFGWLRAAAEKGTDPNWLDGVSLTAFLTAHLRDGTVAVPPYETLIADLFLPNAATLAWLILVGQVLVGVAVVAGALTRVALLAGIVMNINFLLAGEPTPSAFYIAIQLALLCTGTGAVLGLDARLVNLAPLRGLIVRPAPGRFGRVGLPMLAVVCLALAGYALVFVEDWSPAGSVHDPAMVLAVLATSIAGCAAIASLRAESPPRARSTAPVVEEHTGPVIPVSLGLDVSV